MLAMGEDSARAVCDFSVFRLAGLDRLLWIYLRLLFTQHSLDRFLAATNEEKIQRSVEKLESRLAKLGPADDARPQQEKMRKALRSSSASRAPEMEFENNVRSVISSLLAEADIPAHDPEVMKKAFGEFDVAVRHIKAHLVGIRKQNHFIMGS